MGTEPGTGAGLYGGYIAKDGISLRRADGIAQRLQPQRSIFGVFRYAGDVFRFSCPEDTSVHPFGNPISHSTQSGLRAAFSESGFSW